MAKHWIRRRSRAHSVIADTGWETRTGMLPFGNTNVASIKRSLRIVNLRKLNGAVCNKPVYELVRHATVSTFRRPRLGTGVPGYRAAASAGLASRERAKREDCETACDREDFSAGDSSVCLEKITASHFRTGFAPVLAESRIPLERERRTSPLGRSVPGGSSGLSISRSRGA